MAEEIERKFLVADAAWRAETVRSHALRDGLVLGDAGRKVRVRICDDAATLTVKGRRTGIRREEFEYPIPFEDARALLDRHCQGRVVEKTRHVIPFGGFEWTVDVYGGVLAGVEIAEIELPHEDAVFPRPAWLGEEVTGRPEYRKINMLRARLGLA